MIRTMRVRLGASSLNVTMPSAEPFAPDETHRMWLSGTCSRIVVCHERRDQNTFAVQVTFSSDSWLTVSTFFMKLGKSAIWVHWS